MLFFKQVKDNKLNSLAFNRIFNDECHVCSITVKIIAELEKKRIELKPLLASLNISLADYDKLKVGDYCNPVQVKLLSQNLGIEHPNRFENCPRKKG